MKKVFLYALLAVGSWGVTGCDYDDDDIWKAVNEQADRIAALESWQKQVNENIAALQTLVNEGDQITKVTPLVEGGVTIGYTISFKKQGNVNIYSGKNGEAVKAPVIALTEQDGKWYWTLNGEVLKDGQGNPICASGKDGTNAETPLVKTGKELGEGYTEDAVYLSVDGGKQWTKVSNSASSGILAGAPVEGKDSWTFTLSDANGTKITVPKYAQLSLYVKVGDAEKVKITEGQCKVALNQAFSIVYEYDTDFVCEYEVVEGKGNFTLTEGTKELKFAAVSAATAATVQFTLTASNNRIYTYQVEVKAE